MEQNSIEFNSQGIVDFEEQLERFTVRSNKQQISDRPSTSRNFKEETDVIPLLIEDIHQLKLPDRSFAEAISAYGVLFGSVLIYGRISSTGAGANGKIRYCLDDGTGLIQVRLVKQNALKDLHQIDLQCYRTFGNNKELYKSVQNILKTTRQQLLDVGLLKYGTKALLIGRPHRLYNEVIFSVFEMIIDSQRSNDLEISVKNFLVDWYTTRYKSHQLHDPPSSHQ
ncbi:uncharacterized protein LOC129910502 [Episyrphus balteatus]|uniref:uncharacterized protein LOC129910502 n=1 Tax=Episyrphus balteatus TaxID=286459 RepID=UPI0024855F68|nr:uncharacterized protein LOC129910502 [Episyrphus balteatus]